MTSPYTREFAPDLRATAGADRDRIVWTAFVDGTRLYGRRLDTLDGTVSGPTTPLTIDDQTTRVVVVPMSWAHAWVYLHTGNHLRVVTMTDTEWGSHPDHHSRLKDGYS